MKCIIEVVDKLSKITLVSTQKNKTENFTSILCKEVYDNHDCSVYISQIEIIDSQKLSGKSS